MKFRVVLPEFPWRACLEDLQCCLADGLRRAGHDVELATCFVGNDRVEIVLGAHHPAVTLPAYPVIIYQTEVPGTNWFTPEYCERLGYSLAIWHAAPDFVIERTGVPESVVEPGLFGSKAEPVPKDIDVLFYGSLSERRLALLSELQAAGLAPFVHFGVFGAARNRLIDRAKLIVDIKQRADDPNDSTRAFFLDSRGACVLSENDANPDRALVPGQIVAQCRELLGSERLRKLHTQSRRDDLLPMNVGPAVAQLQDILRERNQIRVVAAE